MLPGWLLIALVPFADTEFRASAESTRLRTPAQTAIWVWCWRRQYPRRGQDTTTEAFRERMLGENRVLIRVKPQRVVRPPSPLIHRPLPWLANGQLVRQTGLPGQRRNLPAPGPSRAPGSPICVQGNP
jgi:hypothetical protein